MVPRTGLEPARTEVHGILNPGRLPIPPPRRYLRIILLDKLFVNVINKNYINILF